MAQPGAPWISPARQSRGCGAAAGAGTAGTTGTAVTARQRGAGGLWGSWLAAEPGAGAAALPAVIEELPLLLPLPLRGDCSFIGLFLVAWPRWERDGWGLSRLLRDFCCSRSPGARRGNGPGGASRGRGGITRPPFLPREGSAGWAWRGHARPEVSLRAACCRAAAPARHPQLWLLPAPPGKTQSPEIQIPHPKVWWSGACLP